MWHVGQLTYGMYTTMGLEGALGNAAGSNAPVVRTVVNLAPFEWSFGTDECGCYKRFSSFRTSTVRISRIVSARTTVIPSAFTPIQILFTSSCDVGYVYPAAIVENAIHKHSADAILRTRVG